MDTPPNMGTVTEAAQALLLVLLEPPSTLEEEFNDWYDLEHFPQRTGVPGFIAGERWVATSGWPRYLARYKLKDSQVLDSAQYLAISGPRNSPWSQRILPRTIGRERLALTVFSQRTTQHTPSSLWLIRWPIRNSQNWERLIRTATDFIEQLEGVIEYQWCRDADTVVCVLGFDCIIAPEVLTPLCRVNGVGINLMNSYVRYSR